MALPMNRAETTTDTAASSLAEAGTACKSTNSEQLGEIRAHALRLVTGGKRRFAPWREALGVGPLAWQLWMRYGLVPILLRSPTGWLARWQSASEGFTVLLDTPVVIDFEEIGGEVVADKFGCDNCRAAFDNAAARSHGAIYA
jgi:hypothetical protein